jgi:uncharacterized protein (TIGR03067 family)
MANGSPQGRDLRICGCWKLQESCALGRSQPVLIGTLAIYGVKGFWRRSVMSDDSIIFKYQIDTSVEPHFIDHLCDDGPYKGVLKGIYKFEDKRMIQCFANTIGDDRPTEFTGAKDSVWNLSVWSRVTEIPERNDGVQV